MVKTRLRYLVHTSLLVHEIHGLNLFVAHDFHACALVIEVRKGLQHTEIWITNKDTRSSSNNEWTEHGQQTRSWNEVSQPQRIHPVHSPSTSRSFHSQKQRKTPSNRPVAGTPKMLQSPRQMPWVSRHRDWLCLSPSPSLVSEIEARIEVNNTRSHTYMIVNRQFAYINVKLVIVHHDLAQSHNIKGLALWMSSIWKGE